MGADAAAAATNLGIAVAAPAKMAAAAEQRTAVSSMPTDISFRQHMLRLDDEAAAMVMFRVVSILICDGRRRWPQTGASQIVCTGRMTNAPWRTSG